MNKKVLSLTLASTLFLACNLCAIEGIEDYNKERDNAFVSNLIEENKHDFPEAELFSDLDSEQIEMTVPLENGKTVKHMIKQHIVIYCIDSQPIGFVRVFDLGNSAGMIAQIAVVEEHRCKGFGEKLLNHGIELLKEADVKVLLVDTMADNVTAQKMYDKAGFKKIMDLKDHYVYALQFVTV